MRRSQILARDVAYGDLIIASTGTRMRVTSVEPTNGGSTVIIHGDAASGPVGIAHPADKAIVRLE
jgi:hypothetical protein